MRALLAFLTLVLLAAVGYAVFGNERPDVVASDRNEAERVQNKQEGSETLSKLPVQLPDASSSTIKDALPREVWEDGERATWESFRSAVERLVPDPDGIGPCPPVHLGARPGLVVHRYIRPINGYHVWEHEDDSWTLLHFRPGKDAKTGESLALPVISTIRPTKSKPIFDETKSGHEKR